MSIDRFEEEYGAPLSERLGSPVFCESVLSESLPLMSQASLRAVQVPLG